MKMTPDETAIRKWHADWMKATIDGDLDLAKSLIADGAIFLVPGAGQMNKEDYAKAATASDSNLDFSLSCEIDEIEVLGNHAWLLTTFSLEMTQKDKGSRSLMKGGTLSILKREGSDWVLVRDANTMTQVKDASNG